MARYFAEIGVGDIVQRVIVADTYAWCVETYPTARWEETLQGHSTEHYAGKGSVFVPDDPRRFITQGEADAGE